VAWLKDLFYFCGGEPGIGKSTLILQICDKLKTDGKVLYISGEESANQIKIRADRLGIHNENIIFFGETDIDNIESAINDEVPKLVIIDSIQTMYSAEISSVPRKYKPSKRNNCQNNENVQSKRCYNNNNWACY